MFSCEIFLVKKCSLEALNEANHHAKNQSLREQLLTKYSCMNDNGSPLKRYSLFPQTDIILMTLMSDRIYCTLTAIKKTSR